MIYYYLKFTQSNINLKKLSLYTILSNQEESFFLLKSSKAINFLNCNLLKWQIQNIK